MTTAMTEVDTAGRTLWELCRAFYQHGYDQLPTQMTPRRRENYVKRLKALGDAVKVVQKALEEPVG